MACKMAAENRKLNISDCMADKTEISRVKYTLVWSRNTMETKLITTSRPITKLSEIFKMESKMAAENTKLNITDCMADKTEISSAKHTFLWSRHTLQTKFNTICCPITKSAEIFKMASKMADENRKLNISY